MAEGVIWRQRVDEYIHFEAHRYFRPWGEEIMLFCYLVHPRAQGEVYQAHDVYAPFEWVAMQEDSHYLALEQDRLLRRVRPILYDLEAPALHTQLLALLQGLIERLLPSSILWRNEGLPFLYARYPILCDLEYRIWEDARIPLEEPGIAYCLPARLLPEEMAFFKKIADEAEQWFAWSNKALTYQFLPMPAWRKKRQVWRQTFRGPEYWPSLP